ncbi:MAG: hypothetical protein JOZ96_21305 [Acidobacteria bacterium]|nr:hypothetical protein [Acidobacteriota bacterium]
MERISSEGLLRNIALGALLAQLAVLLTALEVLISGRELPVVVALPLLFAFFVSPLVACGVLVLAVMLGLRGGLSLRRRDVLAGIIMAGFNLAITAGMALLAYSIKKALSGGLTF